MIQMRWILTVGVLLFLVVGMSPWADVGQAQPVIRLGGTISETGRLARVAALYIDGRALGVDILNALGGVNVGGTAYRIELVQFDDQSSADLAVRLYEQLITEQNVDFLLGPYSSGLVIPTSAIAEKFRVPMVEGGGASTNIFNRGFKYVFGTLPAGQNYLKDAIRLFREEAQVRTIALIYADDAFSTDVAVGTRKWANELGVRIIADEKYADGQTEFGSLIAKLKSVNPDVIMGANHLVELLGFVQQARSLGLDKDMVFTVGVSNPDFLALGQVAEGVFGVAPWVPTQSTSGGVFGSAADYTRMFEMRFDYTPEYHNANGTIEILTYKKAIEAAGSLNRNAVRDALANISYESFYGTVAFGENGQVAKGQTVIQIQNGVAVSVGPGGEATAIFKVSR
ncbi:MAG: amino acid ABC transporter substrate-binding protein [Candidatus Bipolaricaulia bacterium]